MGRRLDRTGLLKYECKDIFSSNDCQFYKQTGKCNIDFLGKKCQKTCRLCQPRAMLYFVREPSSVVAKDGQNVTFECQAKAAGNMRIKYLWKFNHSYVNENNSIGIGLESNSHFSVLSIDKVNGTLHAGSYQCLAMVLDYGSIISIPAILEIAYFRIDPQLTRILTATETKPFLIKLPKYDALPQPKFIWEYKSKSLNDYVDVTNDQSFYVTNRGDLLIASVEYKHAPTTYRVFIHHQALTENSLAYLYIVRGRSNSAICADATIISFPTVKNKIVSVGDNVTLECLAVATDCKNQIAISWLKSGTMHISSERRITLNNVKKSDEGSYVCDVQVVRKSQRKRIHYSLRVNEKPKLVKAVDVNATIGLENLLIPPGFSGYTSVSWYKDGQIITNNSHLYHIYANNSLRIASQSPALNGFYQIFCGNDAGSTVAALFVNMSQVGCGWRQSGDSGSIQFNNAESYSTYDDFICSWLLQIPSTDVIELKLVEFSFPAAHSNCSSIQIDLYRASVDSVPPSESFCTTKSMLIPVAFVRGPYILILLRAKKHLLANGGFLINYQSGYSIYTTPTIPSTHTSTEVTSIHYPTTNVTSSKSSSQVMTTQMLAKRKQEAKDSLPLGAVIGMVIGIITIAVIMSVCCYRKRLWTKILRKKSSTNQVPKDSLPRFNISRAAELGSNNHGFQGELRPSAPSIPSEHHQHSNGMALGDYEYADYDRVGAVLRNGDKSQGVYDVVGSRISGGQHEFRPSQNSKGVSILSKLSNTSSTMSEPVYHQLEEGINLTYESADMIKCAKNDSIPIPKSTNQDFARVPSGRSDTQYTPLGEDAVCASKENSIYESLTLERVIRGSSVKSETEMGDYCEPYSIGNGDESRDRQITNKEAFRQNSEFRLESCMLYESGEDVKAPADVFLGEYSDPYEQERNESQFEQLYSEPL